jgi:hypothetical protein
LPSFFTIVIAFATLSIALFVARHLVAVAIVRAVAIASAIAAIDCLPPLLL